MSVVQALIAATNPNFVLVTGDLTYGDEDGQFVVDQHFNDVMVWSRTIPYMPAWGNHEWINSGDNMRNYKGRFDLVNPKSSPGVSSMKLPAASCGVSCEILRSHYPPLPRLRRVPLAFIPVARYGVFGEGE